MVYSAQIYSIIKCCIAFWDKSVKVNKIFEVQKVFIIIRSYDRQRTSCKHLFKELNKVNTLKSKLIGTEACSDLL